MSGRTLLVVSTITVVAAVAGGVAALESPATARQRRLDDNRIVDLSTIQDLVDWHWSQNAGLPAALSDLGRHPGSHVSCRDPLTNEPYEYRALTGNRYELCAVFQQQSRDGAGVWPHGQGRQCFTRSAGAR
jgi:hypothetical protein